MKIFGKTALCALLATSAVSIAAPAAAQVNGMATVDVAMTVVSSQALQNGYQLVGTQYQAQRTTIDQRTQQRQELLRAFDTNNDAQLDEAEAAPLQDPTNATVLQIQAIDAEIQQLQVPINLARVYVVQQVAQQYSASLQQVISDRSIQFVISPEALVYAPEGVDVTPLVVTALNARLPSVSITPPAGWQPTEQVVNLFQQVQNILVMAQQQQQQAAAPQAPATSGR